MKNKYIKPTMASVEIKVDSFLNPTSPNLNVGENIKKGETVEGNSKSQFFFYWDDEEEE